MQIYGAIVVALATLFPPLSFANSVFDLTNSDWSKSVKLDGEWDFAWKADGPFESQRIDAHYQIPSAWTSNSVDGKSFPAFGYGTYQTTLKFSSNHPQMLSISTRRIKLSHRVYINGDLLYTSGNPGADSTSTKHQMMPVISPTFHVPENGKLVLSIVVANYAYVRGGIDSSIEIGQQEIFHETKNGLLISSSFVAGSLLIMSLYHIGLWFKRRRDYSALTFGLFCLAIGVRMLVTNEKILGLIFPHMSAELMLLIELGTVFLGMPILHFFVHSLFPTVGVRKFLFISAAAIAIFLFVLMTGNLYWASYMILAFEIYVLTMLLYVLFIGVLAIFRRMEGSQLFVIGLLVILATAIRDVLIERGVISGLYSLHYGVLAFVFAQSALLSTRFANAYNGMEQLKNNLELLVENRTKELKAAHDTALQVSDQNRRLSTKMTTLLESERRDIAKEIHDNFSSRMVAARMHVTAILKELSALPGDHNDIRISAEKIKDNLKESYTDARALVSRLRPEIIDTLGLSNALRELSNNYDTEQIRVKFHCAIDDKSEFSPDDKIALYRIAQEAITNSIKYSKATIINVELNAESDNVIVVSDNGVGFNPSLNVGNGITHMRERAMSIGGSLDIRSDSSGTIVTVKLSQRK
jgi:signal transduction histidine kinase